jgi:O-antigen/teichoic acid export membrane protein
MLPALARTRFTANWMRTGGAIASFFGLKFIFGLALIGISSSYLSVAGFVSFSQLFLFFALLSTVAAAGVQNGLARQIATANGDVIAEQAATAAAFRIWAFASAALIIAAYILRHALSELLVGDNSLAKVIPLATLAGAAGGYGVLGCAILNGRQRAPTSLVLQSIGLVVGGLSCIWWLLKGDPVAAVLGYAAGPILTSILAATILLRVHIRFDPFQTFDWLEARLLLGYSIAFLAVAVIMPGTLFGLRQIYRESFGTDFLGYWLAANRVSDVTSQILGLYMAQIFLPQVACETEPRQMRHLLRNTLLIGSTVMLGGWALFMIGAPFLVTTFFSPAYLPAIPFIAGYLLGDGLRVAASMAMHWMLARRRLAVAVSIELGSALLMTAYLLILVTLGYREAPYWAYPAAYGTIGLLVLMIWLITGPASLVKSSQI